MNVELVKIKKACKVEDKIRFEFEKVIKEFFE